MRAAVSPVVTAKKAAASPVMDEDAAGDVDRRAILLALDGHNPGGLSYSRSLVTTGDKRGPALCHARMPLARDGCRTDHWPSSFSTQATIMPKGVMGTCLILRA
jgi:hypothetical protein